MHFKQPVKALVETPIGTLTAISDDGKVIYLGTRTFDGVSLGKTDSLFQLENELSLFFENKLQKFETPISLHGTAFQIAVWKTLQKIPYHEVRSYFDVADALQKKNAVRAVANACGKNPLLILVPCHRVLRLNGHLGGFSAGIEKKIELLNLEGSYDKETMLWR